MNAKTTLLSLTGLLLLLEMSGCSRTPHPQTIVDRAIAAHGGGAYTHSIIEFDFRGKHYVVERRGGRFTYKRVFRDSSGRVEDRLSNDGFYRLINGDTVAVAPQRRQPLANSLNSVVYFALLPFPLNDPAVRKRYLDETTLQDQPYHKIEVTFRKEGGGDDYQDVFIYWFHREHHTLDYLAYSFQVNSGGSRFRAARNPRVVNGIRFSDYENYKSPTSPDITTFGQLYAAGELIKVSDIVLENISVRLLSPSNHP